MLWIDWEGLSSVLECWSTVVRRIWTLTCLSLAVFVPPPQSTHLKNALCALATSLWSNLVPQASNWLGITHSTGRLCNYEYTCLTLERAKTYNILDAEVAQVVEQRTENPRVSGSTPLLGTTHEVIDWNYIDSRLLFAKGRPPRRESGPREWVRRSGGMVDATVSKTVGGQPPCRFESDLRHQGLEIQAGISAGLCSGSTEDFGSFSPGSNPGPAAN